MSWYKDEQTSVRASAFLSTSCVRWTGTINRVARVRLTETDSGLGRCEGRRRTLVSERHEKKRRKKSGRKIGILEVYFFQLAAGSSYTLWQYLTAATGRRGCDSAREGAREQRREMNATLPDGLSETTYMHRFQLNTYYYTFLFNASITPLQALSSCLQFCYILQPCIKSSSLFLWTSSD